MSGLTGWVDYERDLRAHGADITWAVGTLACRGPDGEGTWAGRHAALGRRALHTLQGARTGPVKVIEDGRLLTVVSHTGTVLNHAELRRELIARGHRFVTTGDGEVLARAYLQWGAGFCEHVLGPFAAAVWDEREETLLLARDRMGVQPLFYATTPAGVVFGSTMTSVLTHSQVSSTVDAEGLCEVLSYAGTPGLTPFRDLRKVRAGHVLRFTRKGTESIRYWGLTTKPHDDDLKETVGRVRDLLQEGVRLHLTGDAPLSAMLSGGLDSSAISALASAELRHKGEGRLRTFAVSFAGHDHGFRPDDQRSAPDAPYVAAMVASLDADHTEVVVDSADLIDPVVRAAVLRVKELPTPFGDMNTSAYLLARAASEHTRITMVGEGADLIFQGTSWQHEPEIARSGTFPWIAVGQQRGHAAGLGCGLLDPGLLHRLDPAGYARRRFAESGAEVEHLPGASADERLMRELCYANMTRFAENQNNHVEALGQSLGMEVRIPYWHHRLVEYVYNAPWSMQTHDGREKSLLRSAVADLLPDSVLHRRKSPFPVIQDPAYDKGLRAELSELLADQAAPVRPLMDVKAVKRLLADPGSLAGGWLSRTNVELLLQLDAWLRGHSVQLAV
ncbi:asparagine synthase (glutamine-hydrolyzing) [Sinosporangium siamense]|uniref:asparagine synthase (glutamine-hydrolyzing) n=1 Tax=Sinosporangium siamense TaxID=1367973 RepID=A0A919RLK5_9ACTN|nr:asparagine synthase (glutamine-hydrolyzing) [Sinosporangium siamense]GII95060.1 asparagine synthetase B [Sinosporangium siamense]